MKALNYLLMALATAPLPAHAASHLFYCQLDDGAYSETLLTVEESEKGLSIGGQDVQAGYKGDQVIFRGFGISSGVLYLVPPGSKRYRASFSCRG